MIAADRHTLSIISVSQKNLAGLVRTESSLHLIAGLNFEWIVVDTGFCRETEKWQENLVPEFRLRYSCEPDTSIYDGIVEFRISHAATVFVYIGRLSPRTFGKLAEILPCFVDANRMRAPVSFNGAVHTFQDKQMRLTNLRVSS